MQGGVKFKFLPSFEITNNTNSNLINYTIKFALYTLTMNSAKKKLLNSSFMHNFFNQKFFYSDNVDKIKIKVRKEE